MAIRVALNHRTTYRYERSVSLSPQVVRLRPAPHCRTPVLSYALRVEPAEHFLSWQQDPHGNFLARLVFTEATQCFELEVDLVAELTAINPFDFFLEDEALEFPVRYDGWLDAELASYRKCLPAGPRFEEFFAAVPRTQTGTVDFLVELNHYLHTSVNYAIRMDPGVQTCEETLTSGTGSCRDSAWLLVQTLRHLGLPARFVSGYLIQLKPDVKPLDGPAGATDDFTDLHAWAEVYLPGAGWVGLDPTSGLFAGEGHLPLAATPDPASAAPITGRVEPCRTEFEFSMSIARIHEDPRVTKPYDEEQWTHIRQLGERVDQVLADSDVRLTMGGEPTFVSIDNVDEPEWNITSLGEHKRPLAGTLFERLAARFAAGPLLHYGQGKWYPGESLPRWELACYWRTDGEPVWNNPQLVVRDGVDYGATPEDAKRFTMALAERLGVDGQCAIEAYEDVWYFLWKSHRLPVNVDPLDSRLSDPEERARLARVFEQGLGNIVGYALPLRAVELRVGQPAWESGPWHLPQEHMYLVPGDSPMGLRLPLDSLPWMAEQDVPLFAERDPYAPRGALPCYHPSVNGQSPAHNAPSRLVPEAAAVAAGGEAEAAGASSAKGVPVGSHATFTKPAPGQSAASRIRTALCVESRQGALHVFMPPVSTAEEYLHLASIVEQTAGDLRMPVRVEGYQPPYDGRLRHFKVTPDPGVIEVNLQPAGRWAELVENTTVLYEEARQSRLGTEKFMLDGRHTGTGGGNHVVLGGATPPDSPFLRRPELLGSLIRYWNNHPSLSYIFSGLFVGPTSQAPRVDEARHEALYELETALAQLPLDASAKPWMVDRALRNLLVDVTGNTHRTEFCIDKLFSPETANGRLGLVEFRGFEMPPHAQMSLAQQLVLRALVAWQWNQPYRQPLVRWGTALHDRFMLPHFVAADFRSVVDDLSGAGLVFDQQWFAPHFEFRFPLVGQVTHRNIQIELRQAIEPWHVLGEESAGGTSARNVDSSLERLQITVRGLTDPRHVVACNGRRIPLQPTGTSGEFVAGIRFRAWQPPECLHPTIGIHTPLVFDVLDTWNDRSIGGCTWHVSHPSGRHFDRLPVNALEAEGRRVGRFLPIGHTGGHTPIPPVEVNRDYPYTLDLRRGPQPATLDEG